MAIFAPDERQPNSATLLHGHVLILQAELDGWDNEPQDNQFMSDDTIGFADQMGRDTNGALQTSSAFSPTTARPSSFHAWIPIPSPGA